MAAYVPAIATFTFGKLKATNLDIACPILAILYSNG
jgi:hypothetical protein